VLISGPCTFAALLTSVKLGMRSVRIEKRGAEVLALLQGVQEEFSKYAETVAKAGQRARQLEDELNSVEVRARAVARRLRDISTDDV
ncbi:MAG: DNA recombination protein RmuC, partial [Clostridiales bacterium]|nr:DNA recombination protein RmuC [Clostridiales bacterium]